MRKRLSLLLATVCVLPAAQLSADCKCECDTISHTFFSVRPQFQSASPEKTTMFRDRMDARDDGRGGAFQLAVFGGKSTRTEDLRHFFFPSCKDKLNVTEVTTSTDLTLFDLNALHFNVVSQHTANLITETQPYSPFFESSITMCPRQSTFGIGMTYRQNLTALMDEKGERDYSWWFEISSPLVYIKNDLQLKETITTTIDDAGGVLGEVAGLEDQIFVSNMTEAFKQKAWKYGKIDTCGRTKWGLADIEVKFGGEWVKEDSCRLEGYVGVLIPTSNKPCAEYMFEPIVGHNKHWGFIEGGTACFKIWEAQDEDKKVKFVYDMQGMYLFSRLEKRSFDLKCKAWSRYMRVYENKDQAQMAYNLFAAQNYVAAALLSSPGINTFTEDLNVSPRINCNSNMAVIYNNGENGFRGEFGYNFYARQSECVELACAWKKEAALVGSNGAGETSRFGTIIDPKNPVYNANLDENVNIDRDINHYDESIITESDLDLESAAHPASFSHTIYASMGKIWDNDEKEYPAFLSGGCSYEFSQDNNALNRWMLWVKGGVSF